MLNMDSRKLEELLFSVSISIRFFDCINVCKFQRNILCSDYEDVNDSRFDWLDNSFLKYFQEWKQSIERRPGNYTRTIK